MNCEKCKTDLFDKEASTDNWSVFKAKCPKCGTRSHRRSDEKADG